MDGVQLGLSGSESLDETMNVNEYLSRVCYYQETVIIAFHCCRAYKPFDLLKEFLYWCKKSLLLRTFLMSDFWF